MDKSSRKLIRKLLRKYKTNCPFRLAQLLNIEIWFEDLGADTRGLYRKTLRRKYIVINSGLSEAWQRVICAHELAHALLHPGISRFWIDEHTLFHAGKFEREANQFAVDLLIPDELLLNGMTIYEAAVECGVPPELAHLKQPPNQSFRREETS